MNIAQPAELNLVLSGDPLARRALVEALTAPVRAHVTRALFRHRAHARGRHIRQEVEDMVQEVFSLLFEDGGNTLRAWCPTRGASFSNFVGLVAERHVAAVLRSGRRSPWRAEIRDPQQLDSNRGPDPDLDARVAHKDFGQAVLGHLACELSPRGREVFRVLFAEERAVSDATERLRVSADVVYAWRNRIIKRARQIGADLEKNVSPAVRSAGLAHKERREGKVISMIGISRELVTQLETLPAVLHILAQRVSAESARAAAAGAGFSFVEHAWHLADLEREAFSLRITRLLEEDAPVLPDFDGDREARVRRYRERDLEPAISAFAAERAANLARLERVPPPAWSRAGTQEGVGAVTLVDIPCRMLDHDRAHAAELMDLLASMGAAHLAPPALAELARAAKPFPCAA
ncbi:MAG TPA: DinB family protein [Polyangiaceae bacterium]|nr:DinB family protein [Polyangiaceae bacterium]